MKILFVIDTYYTNNNGTSISAQRFASELRKRGIAAETQSAIVPVEIGDEIRAVAAAAGLLERGFLIPAIRYPTVARGKARLRVAVSAVHSRETLAAAAEAIAETLKT